MTVKRWTRALTLLGLTTATLALANSTAFVSWIAPQAYTDGTAMDAADIKHTTIRCSGVIVDGQRRACAIPTRIVPGGTNSTAIDFVLAEPRGGQVCFQAQVETTNGALSDWTAEACKTVAGKKPMPPVLTVR